MTAEEAAIIRSAELPDSSEVMIAWKNRNQESRGPLLDQMKSVGC